jgi:hypothetical protein
MTRRTGDEERIKEQHTELQKGQAKMQPFLQSKEHLKGLLEVNDAAGTLSMLCEDEDSASLGQRLASDTGLKDLLDEIKSEAQALLEEPDPELTEELYGVYRKTGERLSYERPYFRKRKRLNTFAIMALVEPQNDTYRNALLEIVESICNEATWCLPAHYSEQLGPLGSIDLFAAETGFALAELSVLLQDKLPSELLDRIGDEVEKRLFQPFLNAVSYSWEGLRNNWSAVCGGSIGAAALYLISDKDRLSAILERSIKATNCFLEGYGDDGACVEGYLYWQYGFGYYVYFVSLLKRATGGGFDGFAISKVQQIAMFQQRSFSSRETVINFSDSLPRSGVFMGLTWRLRDEYPEIALPHPELRCSYNEDHCGRWAPALRNLIWASGRERVEAAHEDWPAEAVYMADSAWMVSRHTGEDGSVYCFAAKGGHNDEPHNHNDCGSFLLHADGEAYLAELGSGMYTEAYFGPRRYQYWCNGSQGHSLPIVRGCTQSPGDAYAAKIITAEIGEDEDRFALELAGAYPEEAGLKSLIRQFRWRKTGRPGLELRDIFVLKNSASLGKTVLLNKSAFLDNSVLLDKSAFLDNSALLNNTASLDNSAAPKTSSEMGNSFKVKDGGSGEGTAPFGENVLTERFITLLEPKLERTGMILLEGGRKLNIYYDEHLWSPQVTKRSDTDHFGRERSWYSLDFRWIGDAAAVRGGEIVACFEFAFA